LAVVSTQCCCFQCVDIGASKVVFSVPAIDCSAGNSKYIGWLVVAVLLLIVFVIGLPAMILVFLCRNRWHLENDEDVAGALGPLFEVRGCLCSCRVVSSSICSVRVIALSQGPLLHGTGCVAPPHGHGRPQRGPGAVSALALHVFCHCDLGLPAGAFHHVSVPNPGTPHKTASSHFLFVNTQAVVFLHFSATIESRRWP
jgi:hypothetical protein